MSSPGEGSDAVPAPDAGKPKDTARKLLNSFGLWVVCLEAGQGPPRTLSPCPGGWWWWAAPKLGLILPQPSCCKRRISQSGAGSVVWDFNAASGARPYAGVFQVTACPPPTPGSGCFPAAGNTTASLKNNLLRFQRSLLNRPSSFYLIPGCEAKTRLKGKHGFQGDPRWMPPASLQTSVPFLGVCVRVGTYQR